EDKNPSLARRVFQLTGETPVLREDRRHGSLRAVGVSRCTLWISSFFLDNSTWNRPVPAALSADWNHRSFRPSRASSVLFATWMVIFTPRGILNSSSLPLTFRIRTYFWGSTFFTSPLTTSPLGLSSGLSPPLIWAVATLASRATTQTDTMRRIGRSLW